MNRWVYFVTTMSKRLYIKTFGCQMNEHDSEKIAGVFTSLGYQVADGPEHADMIILNTCSIREKAEQKCFSDLGRLRMLKKENPDLLIGVGGCVAQQEGERILERAPYVDIVFGTDNIHEIPQLLLQREKEGRGVRLTQRHKRRVDIAARRAHPVKAWVSIVDGCDRFCTFCVVPQTRGREKSRYPEEIKQEITDLARQGHREITLLGQNVNAYGKDLSLGMDLADLLEYLHDVPGIERYRFITSHPSAFHPKLARVMASLPKVCEALHLPLQSGSNPVLNRMKREYTIEEYTEKIVMLREYIPDVTLTTDIIVGFPGESEEDFEKTLETLRHIRYDDIYAFHYSRRPHTTAMSMENQVPRSVREERLQVVLALQEAISLENNKRRVGTVQEVLVEGIDRLKRGRMTGRTRGNKIVHIQKEASEDWLGRLIPVKITEATLTSLRGDVVL